MEECSTERPIDPLDHASAVEEMLRNHAIAAHKARIVTNEVPDEDEEGNRYCVSCGDDIPAARVALVPHAVRCVKCESALEERKRIARARGGFMDDDE